jgi:hypothetical protein
MFVKAYYVKDHLLTYIYCLVIVAKGKFNQNHANYFSASHLLHTTAEERARDSIRLPITQHFTAIHFTAGLVNVLTFLAYMEQIRPNAGKAMEGNRSDLFQGAFPASALRN